MPSANIREIQKSIAADVESCMARGAKSRLDQGSVCVFDL